MPPHTSDSRVDATNDHGVAIDLEYDPKVATLHLGERKYSTPSRAIGELVANGFDAGASLVSVEVVRSDLGGDVAIRVADNGRGMTVADIRERFAKVGVANVADGSDTTFARFGVGRFAAHRLGRVAMWSTLSEADGRRAAWKIRMDADRPGVIVLTEENASALPTGTLVEIHDLADADSAGLQPARIASDLANQFCAFLIGNPARTLLVQGTPVDPSSLIDRSSSEEFTVPGSTDPIVLRHLILHSPVDKSRFPEQILYTARGRTVDTEQAAFPLAPHYLALVEWGHLEELVTSNRESLLRFDPLIEPMRMAVNQQIEAYQKQLQGSHARLFLREARARSYYPFAGPPRGPVDAAEQVMYDAVLSEVNQQVNLQSMSQRQQAVVFRLLRRALENEDLVDILAELVDLSDKQLRRFRQALARATLDSIIHLAAEVTWRLEYLDQLHHLIYGPIRSHVLERSHLHKLLERGCWIFGEEFHLATSDQSFRAVIARHRAGAGMPALDESELAGIKGIDLIPDLFLAADKEYPQPPEHRRLLVEIKAPKVDIGKAELDQIQRYAEVVIESPEFDPTSTEWDFFLVSAGVKPEIRRLRQPPDRPFGMIERGANYRVWVFTWGELISRARDELKLVRDHLDRTASEQNLDYWKQEFPEIVEGIERRVAKAQLKLEK